MTSTSPHPSTAADFYSATAEHVAVLLGPTWQALGPALAAALDGLDAAAGPIVDVGAGTGPGTRVIAAAVPAAEIIAVEPDRALRTALLTGVAADPGLRERVTVLDADLLGADLPERIGGLIAMNVLGHFSPADRDRVWGLLASRLAPGGRAVLDLPPPHEPVSMPSTPAAEVAVGRRRYRVAAAAEPAGADALTWEMSYSVEQDGREVAAFSARNHWRVLAPARVAEEVAAHGLRLRPHDPATHLFVIEHTDDGDR